jgi:hypothetical protein
MLTLSGVVRPSHVELRYAISRLNSDDQSSAFQGKSGATVQPPSLLQKFFKLLSWPTKDEQPLTQHLPNNNPLRSRYRVSTGARSSA